ncbi:hypothetical protein J3R30DRAFT_3551633 [Lentinula aciculospora]|uniref:Uncharacterized protein n=1 Tax=Lentinula aciculospora TaxID=153920 RepID=A0A9W9DGD3_9AGAR|nr:hypothetical protein J3R30DRAFT_3551633 [Lentinula aciculospora]
MRCDFHHQRFNVIYTAFSLVCLASVIGQLPLGTKASPVRRVTSVNLASIPATTATTCPFQSPAMSSNGHSDSTRSPGSNSTTAKTQDPHDKRAGVTLKLYRLICLAMLEDAVHHPDKTVIPGPTSFSYLGGLDMTPSPETAEAWGLHELQNSCPSIPAEHGLSHKHVLIEYTLKDPRSKLDILDLDVLEKDQAALRRLVPPGIPVPANLVTWVCV